MGVLNLIWRLPANILNSAASSLTSPWISHGATTRKSPRRRPLQTCGASCIAIARKATAKAQDLDAPLGSMAKRSISIFNTFCPTFVYSTGSRCLALLIVIDDHILAIEGKLEAILPRSACLFDGIDGLVSLAEALPGRFDDAVRKFPTVIHQFPLLDWVVVHLISWLSSLLSILVHVGSKSAREKEITVDVNCKTQDKSSTKEHTKLVQFEKPYSYADAARNHAVAPKSVQFEERENTNGTEVTKGVPTEVIHLSVKRLHSWRSRIKALEEPLYAGDSPMYSSYQSANSSPVSDCSQDENQPFNQTLGCTYKEILEREKKEDEEEEQEQGGEDVHLKDISEQVIESN